MRGKRSSPPVPEYQWGASILPGGPPSQAPTPPGAVNPPIPAAPEYPASTEYARAAPVAPEPHQFSAPPQPFAPQPPVGVPSRFGNTPEFGGSTEVPATQRLGRPADFNASPVGAPAFNASPVGAPAFGAAPVGAPSFGGQQFATPQFGTTAPPFGTPQGFYPGAGPAYGPPPGRRVPVAVWIVIAAVGGFIVLGILAAIAIPVFLSQQQKPANRSVSLPSTIVGQTQLQTPELLAASSQAIAAMVAPNGAWGPMTASYYGSDTVPVLWVGAAKLKVRPTAADESAFFANSATGESTGLTSVGAGPFGGRMECGPKDLNGISSTECVSVDSAAVVVTVVFDTSQDQAALLARQIISAVEH